MYRNTIITEGIKPSFQKLNFGFYNYSTYVRDTILCIPQFLLY